MLLLRLTLLSVCVWSTVTSTLADSLEVVKDDELRNMIEHEKYVVVLFGSDSSLDLSEKLESELALVRETLVESINAWVVKADHENTKLRKDYLIDEKKPTIVFFRNKKPVIYDGSADEEEILETLSAFKETCTQDLTDTNFEHLTQASTGATTGDWFVLFYRDDCELCERLGAKFETLACRMKGRMNVAQMNRETTGAITGRRLGVSKVPEMVFFRLGRMYRYTIEKYDVESMTSFVTGFYKNVKEESIPLPKTPFDDLVQLCVDYLREYPFMFAICVSIPLLLGLAFYFLTRSDDDHRVKSKKKKKKDKST